MPRKSTYKRYFISYCTIALIPVVVVLLAVISVMQFSYSNTSKELYRRSLTQAASHLDTIISQLQSTAGQFTADWESDDIDSRIVSYLRIVQGSSPLETETAFYRLSSTDIYTVEGKMPYKEFENSLADKASLSHSAFFTQLNSVLSFNIVPLYQMRDSKTLADRFAILIPCYGSDQISRGIFIFILSGESICSVVTDYLGATPDYLYFYTPQLALAGCFEDTSQTTDNRLRMLRTPAGAVTTFSLNNKNYDVLHFKSDAFGVHFVAAVRLNDLYMDANRLQSTLLFVFFPLTAGLVLLAVLLARYSYRPIRALLDTVSKNSDAPLSPADNEIQYIGRHIEQAHSRIQDLSATLSRQHPYVLTGLLQRMLRGSVPQAEIAALLPSVTALPRGYVVLTHPENQDAALLLNGNNYYSFDTMEAWGVYLEEEGCLAYLCFTSLPGDCRLRQCRELADELRVLGAAPALCAGSVVRAADAMSQSFLEAYIVLNKPRTPGQEAITLYQADAKENFAELSVDDGRALELYLQSLRSVDADTSAAILDKLLQKILPPFGSVLNALYRRYNLFYSTLAQCEEEVSKEYKAKNVPIELFSDEKRFHDLMHEVTRCNCAAVEKKRDDTFAQKRYNIFEILQENYTDSTFSLSRLSELSGYSPTYINHLLKKETGFSYIQYVSGLRMERVKTLLLEGDEPIRNIVQSCGYLDLASFNRKFKEYTGVTPGEFRRQKDRSAGLNTKNTNEENTENE